ncbi:MAG: serine/threonine protein kinase, partial [Dolichospermum sp.]
NPTNSLARKLDNEVLISPQEIIVTISDELNEAILTGMALEAKDRPELMETWLQMLNYNLPIYNVEQNIVNVEQNIINVEEKNPTVIFSPLAAWITGGAVPLVRAILEAATAGVAVFAVVGGIAMSVAVPVLVVKAIVGDKLEKSFSKFHAFLI